MPAALASWRNRHGNVYLIPCAGVSGRKLAAQNNGNLRVIRPWELLAAEVV